MSAAEALREARTAGIELRVEGCDLALQAHTTPPADLLERLALHKLEIVALLRPGRDGWSAEDWKVFYDERAGIAEFDGSLPRADAEARALDCCLAEWLIRNPVNSDPANCLLCKGGDYPDPLLSIGISGAGQGLATPALRAGVALHPQNRGTDLPQGDGASCRLPSSQTISEITETHDGWLRIGTAERFRARHSRSLPVD